MTRTPPRTDASEDAYAEIRASGRGELAPRTPLLLGVRPGGSVIVVGPRGARVEAVARAGLGRLVAVAIPGSMELAGRVGVGAEVAVLVVHGDGRNGRGELPARSGVAVPTGALGRRGIEVFYARYVSCGRWRSYACAAPGRRGPVGRPPRVERSPALATASRAGRATFPDPAAMAADLAPPSGATPRLRLHLVRAETRFVAQVADQGGIGPWRQEVDGRFETACDRLATSRIARAETAALVVALVDRAVRDRCWERVEGGGADERWLNLWRHLARHAVAPYRVEPLFLFGWTAWRRGDGISARVAVDCALQEDPEHRATGMLAELLRAGVDPRTLPPLKAAGPADGPLRP